MPNMSEHQASYRYTPDCSPPPPQNPKRHRNYSYVNWSSNVHCWRRPMAKQNEWQSAAYSPPAKLRGYLIKVHHQIFVKRRRSSAVLTRASMLRSSHPLWNASVPNEGDYANFRGFAPKIGYHSDVPWVITKRKSVWSCRPMYVCPENLVNIGSVHSEIIGQIIGLQGDR